MQVLQQTISLSQGLLEGGGFSQSHSVHAPSFVLSLIIHYQVLQATECNKLAIQIWIGHYELQRRRNQTPQSKLEFRTALNQCLIVNKQKPAENPFSLFLNVWSCSRVFRKCKQHMRSFDGAEQTQCDLHMGGDGKGLGMNSHLLSPQSNSKWQVCINNVTRRPASAKKALQAWELCEKRGILILYFALYSQHYVFEQVEEAYKTPFFPFIHITKNYHAKTQQLLIVRVPESKPKPPIFVATAHAGKSPPSLTL